MLTYHELIHQIKKLDVKERLGLLEEISHSLKNDITVFPSSKIGAEHKTYSLKVDTQGNIEMTVRENGLEKPIAMSGYAQLITSRNNLPHTTNSKSIAIAHSLLNYQFGVDIADKYVWEFSTDKIKMLRAGQSWQITSDELNAWFNQMDINPPTDTNLIREDYANFLAEKYQ